MSNGDKGFLISSGPVYDKLLTYIIERSRGSPPCCAQRLDSIKGAYDIQTRTWELACGKCFTVSISYAPDTDVQACLNLLTPELYTGSARSDVTIDPLIAKFSLSAGSGYAWLLNYCMTRFDAAGRPCCKQQLSTIIGRLERRMDGSMEPVDPPRYKIECGLCKRFIGFISVAALAPELLNLVRTGVASQPVLTADERKNLVTKASKAAGLLDMDGGALKLLKESWFKEAQQYVDTERYTQEYYQERVPPGQFERVYSRPPSLMTYGEDEEPLMSSPLQSVTTYPASNAVADAILQDYTRYRARPGPCCRAPNVVVRFNPPTASVECKNCATILAVYEPDAVQYAEEKARRSRLRLSPAISLSGRWRSDSNVQSVAKPVKPKELELELDTADSRFANLEVPKTTK